MDDTTLINIWKEYDKKLDDSRLLNIQSWVLNIRAFETIQAQKAKSKIKTLAMGKIITVFLGAAWVFFLGFIVYHSLAISNVFFVVSVSAIMTISAIAVLVYIKHLILINQINNSDQIIDTQEKLAALQSSTLWIVRIIFLQLPFYSTWYLNHEMVKNGNWGLWIFQITMTVFFIFLSIWLYRNINFRNINKRWFKILFSGAEWTSVLKALSFLNEIEEFKKDKG